MGSYAPSRASGFSEFTPPPSPEPVENVVGPWADTFPAGEKRRKPGVTWDVQSGSPPARFPRLNDSDGEDEESEDERL